MASFKTKALGVLILLIVVGLAVAGGYGWKTWKQYQAAQALQRAESLLSEGQAAEADRLLDTLILGAPNPEAPWIDGALAMRLFALEQLGDPAAQTALASRVMAPDAPWGEPTGATLAWGHLILGRAALDQKQADPAREHFETFLALPRPAVPEPYAPSPYEAELGLARLQLADAAQFETGRERLQTLLENPDALPAPVRQKAEEILGLVNIRTLLNRQPQDDDQLYQIERGDTIDGMARRFRVSGDLITRVNGITNPRALTIGRRLKIPNLDLSIVVNKSDNTLTLYNDGKFFKKYSVRTGEVDYMTPNGDYRIQSKTKDPSWTNPKTRERFEPGAPGNELGSRWMGFSTNTGLGIHEAIDPSTVGTYGSNGCVGLKQEDVEELYDLIPLGTPITIVGDRVDAQPRQIL